VHLDPSTPESVEQTRRSIAMLAPRAWALCREEASEILEVLCVALRQLEQIDRAVRRHPAGGPRRR
jgi:hypothetical protein